MKKRIGITVCNLSLILTSLLFALLGAEVLLRAYYDAPPNPPGHQRLFVQYDPVLGWVKRPNTTNRHVKPEYAITESINSRGIRGPEYSYNKKPNESRVLVLGDSFAEGYTVNFQEVFSEVYKSNLNGLRADTYYEVINTGTGGYSTDQEVIYFLREGKKYKPDLTVLMFYDNDVWYNNQPRYWRGYKPQYKLVNGKLHLSNTPLPQPSKEDAHQILQSWLQDNSYLYGFVAHKIRNVKFLRMIAAGFIRVANANAFPVPNEYLVYEKNLREEAITAWNITEKLIEKLKKETSSIGSKLVVFYVPKRAIVYDDEWEAMKTKYGMTDSEWNITAVRDRIKDICEKNGIHFIDPTDAFRKKAHALGQESKRLYFVIDGHWTAEGHNLAGEILARHFGETYFSKRRKNDGDSKLLLFASVD